MERNQLGQGSGAHMFYLQTRGPVHNICALGGSSGEGVPSAWPGPCRSLGPLRGLSQHSDIPLTVQSSHSPGFLAPYYPPAAETGEAPAPPLCSPAMSPPSG